VNPPLHVLAGGGAWVVGGAVRDRLLGRSTDDVDVAVGGDPRAAARAMKEATGAAIFPLSEAFGAWRVISPARDWQVDITPLRDGDLLADLAARDFTVNAMAEPVGGGDVVDPHGGREDLAARRLRMVSPTAFDDDPLRTLRAVRLAAELSLEIVPETLAAATERAPRLAGIAAERIWAELRRVVGAPDPVAALELMARARVTDAVLPELVALRGVEQNVFHHRDVYGHTLEVLGAAVGLERDPSILGETAAEVDARLREPVGDGLSRWGSLRWAALLHDIAKPQTRRDRPDGRGSSFVGHDSEGAEVVQDILRRLRASERVVGHVSSLTRNHLHAGFLVHQRPISARAIHRYLKATEPWEVDVTVLTVADRLATRGRGAEEAIAAHVDVARELLAAALADRSGAPLVRGDELARELGIAPGPRLGELLARLEEDRYAGVIRTREEAVRRARELLDTLRPQ
jgi:putative nucleotidyltransferase with HDIG domain